MRLALVVGALWLAPAAIASDVEAALFATLDAALDQGHQNQLDLLTPDAWDDAIAARGRARTNFERNRALDTIQRYIDEAKAALSRANEMVPASRATFTEVLLARADALSANADKMATRTWGKAVDQFHDAATTLEHGHGDRAKQLAGGARDGFRAAELEAIKSAILVDVRALLDQADREKVDKYAPISLAAAKQSLAEATKALNEDRYDTDRPRLYAREAREQASHALYLTAIVKALDDGDLSREQALLDGEKPVLKIADALDLSPDLSNGVASTTDAILAEVKRARKHESELTLGLDEANEKIATLEAALGGASQEAVALSSLLAEQEARRTQLEEVEHLFAENEAEVLHSGTSVIIRLVGLRFDSGASTIKEEHHALLAKVEAAMKIYDSSTFTVEGHTDSFGSDASNYDLSQRRADAVRAYLLSDTGLADYRIAATGYGETRPIATNETAEGRAKNRRIDFVIRRS